MNPSGERKSHAVNYWRAVSQRAFAGRTQAPENAALLRRFATNRYKKVGQRFNMSDQSDDSGTCECQLWLKMRHCAGRKVCHLVAARFTNAADWQKIKAAADAEAGSGGDQPAEE